MQLTAFFIIFVLVMTSGGQMRKLKFSKNSFNSIQLSCSKEVDVPAAIVYRKRLSCLLFQFSSFHPPPAGPVTMSGSDMIRRLISAASPFSVTGDLFVSRRPS